MNDFTAMNGVYRPISPTRAAQHGAGGAPARDARVEIESSAGLAREGVAMDDKTAAWILGAGLLVFIFRRVHLPGGHGAGLIVRPGASAIAPAIRARSRYCT